MYTKDILETKSKEQLIGIILGMQENLQAVESTKKIGDYYNRKTTLGSKFADITPEFVAKEHKSGKSLATIVNELNEKFEKEGRVNKAGKPVKISIQVIYHKLKQYEEQTGEEVYRPAKKGRKRKV